MTVFFFCVVVEGRLPIAHLGYILYSVSSAVNIHIAGPFAIPQSFPFKKRTQKVKVVP